MVAQSKLLRVQQEGEVERLGCSGSISVDLREGAATTMNPRDEVRAARFREDLFGRLNVFPIELPALRERRDDVLLLFGVFSGDVCCETSLHGRRIHAPRRAGGIDL